MAARVRSVDMFVSLARSSDLVVFPFLACSLDMDVFLSMARCGPLGDSRDLARSLCPFGCLPLPGSLPQFGCLSGADSLLVFWVSHGLWLAQQDWMSPTSWLASLSVGVLAELARSGYLDVSFELTARAPWTS